MTNLSVTKTLLEDSIFGSTWEAGVSQLKITPNAPTWMAGYAARSQPSQGITHDLWVKVLVLRTTHGLPNVLITLDICGFDRFFSNRVCWLLYKRYGLTRDRIVISFSHTHTGPVVGNCLKIIYNLTEEHKKVIDVYTESLLESIAEAVDLAHQNVQKAVLSWGVKKANFAVNRLENPENSIEDLRKNLRVLGPVDHDVPILAIKNVQNLLLAVVYGYACHCTTLNSRFYRFSGDYAGFANIAIQKEHPESVAMFVAGCGADQNPLPRGSVSLAQKYGTELAEVVCSALSEQLDPLSAALDSGYHEKDLRFQKLPTMEYLRDCTMSSNLYLKKWSKGLIAKIKTGEGLSEVYPYPIQVWRLGNSLNWFFMGGEPVVEYSLRLKLNLGSSQTWVSGYCNDLCSYIPNQKVLAKNGYEGKTSMIYYGLPSQWEPGKIERDIYEGFATLISILIDKNKSSQKTIVF